ncbi:MAG: thymidylate synthase [Candidatus Colwellbacteria bacterium]|nr:thymidylate synthase [Candidatus Colwellbacteria bacterium]MCK9497840.1 thymidylate synthase [Candidatus Colwellbacteria bacterium]MDD3752814.1 thymidylate synthase [Candidatus Colwellbacteria bacterium]
MIGLLNFIDYYAGNFFRRVFGKRTKDIQYRSALKRILKRGVWVSTPQKEDALRVIGIQMRFDLKNGFPIITERDILSIAAKGGLTGAHAAIAEIIAFINGARTNSELKKFGCNWWGRWTKKEYMEYCGLDLEEGDLGPGSYGPAFHDFPTAEGIPFNQVKHVIEQINELPILRTHMISTWIPQYAGRGEGKQRKTVVATCHGTVVHFLVDVQRKEISLHHVQRSGDMPVGVVWNLIQYSALLLMVAKVTGYKPKEIIHTISDAHIYKRQIDDVRELLKTRIGSFPDLVITNKSVKDIFDFRPEDFSVIGYKPMAGRRKICTPT